MKKILAKLERKYPNKDIFQNKDENGKGIEIICEIEPTSIHPEYSVAIAIADKSVPHYHKKTKETYKVIKGALSIYISDKKTILNEGDEITIDPGTIHWIEGNETWFECTSKPGWTVEDHIIQS